MTQQFWSRFGHLRPLCIPFSSMSLCFCSYVFVTTSLPQCSNLGGERMGSGPLKTTVSSDIFTLVWGAERNGWGAYEERGGAGGAYGKRRGCGLKLSFLKSKKGSVWRAAARKNKKWLKKGWGASTAKTRIHHLFPHLRPRAEGVEQEWRSHYSRNPDHPPPRTNGRSRGFYTLNERKKTRDETRPRP